MISDDSAAVELRLPAARIREQVAFYGLLAVIPSLLLTAFLQKPLLKIAVALGETRVFLYLLLTWALCLLFYLIAVWWHFKLFILRADDYGISWTACWRRRFVRWRDIATATAEEPAAVGGSEYIDMLAVVLRNSQGRTLLTLDRNLSGGLPSAQVAAFKYYVRAQLVKNAVARDGEPLAWINWM